MKKTFLLLLFYLVATKEILAQPFTINTSTFTPVYSAGVDWGDYDNDGDLDLMISGSTNTGSSTNIFENQTGNFIISTSAGIGNFSNCDLMWLDYDNDGELDYLHAGANISCAYTPLIRNDLTTTNTQNLATFTDPAFGLQTVRSGSVDIGDFDNDGDQDLVLAGMESSTSAFHSIIYRNDNGIFVNINAPIQDVKDPTVRWVDYDNDRDLDLFLAGATSTQCISELYRNDNGIFNSTGFSFTGLKNVDADWGDYDNDGDLDLLMTGDSVIYFPITRLYRNDIFSFNLIPVNIPNVGEGSVSWADYDNDGDLDVLACGDSSHVSFTTSHLTEIYRNDGNNNFSAISAGIIGVQSANAKWGDYDNDGDIDFVLTGSSTSSSVTKIFENQLPLVNANTLPIPPVNLQQLTIADTTFFDWDKSTDNETPQNGLSYNMYCGTSPSTINIITPMSNVSNGFHKEAKLGNTGSSNGWKLYNLSPGTYWWGVQTIDQIYAGSVFSTENKFTIFDTAAPTLYFPFKNSSNVSIPTIGKWFSYAGALSYHIVVSDSASFSSIIFEDSLVTDTAINILNLKLNTKYYWKVRANLISGNSEWSNTWIFNSIPFFSKIDLGIEGVYYGKSDFGDYDNDNDMDLLITGSNWNSLAEIYKNTNGIFTDQNIGFSSSISVENGCWGDFDNDNDLDVAFTGAGGLKIYKNNNGSFVLFQSLAVFSSIAWGDYDNDGDLDLAAIGNKLLRNDGSIFTVITLPINSYTESTVSWGDYDKDNDLDLLITGIYNGGGYTKLLKNTNGIFTVVTHTMPGIFRGASKWGDFDMDGDLDILLVGQKNTIPWSWYVYRNDSGQFNLQFTEVNNFSFGDGEWGDYDNDGDLDIILTGADKTYLYKNSLGTFEKQNDIFIGLNYSSINWVDYDNDNDLDLFLTGNYTSGPTSQKVSFFYKNNTIIHNTIPISPSNLTSVVSGDSILFSWSNGWDFETLDTALYYNFYLGSTPLDCNSNTPMANVLTGYRKIIDNGNSCSNTSWKLKNISSGTYYWSVQSIDHMYTGSPFAAEQVINILNADNILNSETNEVIVFPNPTFGDFKILNSGKEEIYKIEIYSIDSKLIYSENITQPSSQQILEMTKNQFSTGTYILKIITPKGVINKKIIFL